MKTIQLSEEQMERHIARFDTVKPKSRKFAEENGIPVGAYEMIAAKDIFLMMAAPESVGPHVEAPITVDAGVTVNICKCPPGNGPMLHAHMKTNENFMCLEGAFELRWGDEGENRTELQKFDIAAVPPGVSRAFKNITEKDAFLLVFTTGDSLDDVAYAPSVGAQLSEKFGEEVLNNFQKIGFSFDAGVS